MFIVFCDLEAVCLENKSSNRLEPILVWFNFWENRITLSDPRVSLPVSLADSLTVTLQRRCSTGSLFRQLKGDVN